MERWEQQEIRIDRGQEIANKREKIVEKNKLPKEKRQRGGKQGLALLYPNMPSILSQRAEECRDIIISPPQAVSLY